MKFGRIFICVCMAAVVWSGCQGQVGNRVSRPPLPGESETSVTVPTDGEQSGADAAPLQEELLTAALDGILNCEQGTAGSSLKTAAAAAGFLDFAEGYDPGQAAQLKEAASAYLSGLDEAGRERFGINFPAVMVSAGWILEDETGQAAALLSDAGIAKAYDAQLLDAFDSAKTQVEEALASLEQS